MKYTRKYILGKLFENPKEVRVLDIFERYNPSHPFKVMIVAEVFYVDNDKGIIEYVDVNDLRITDEESQYKGDKYELFKQYGGEYYIENGLYNFVCYDGIKL